MSVNFNETFRAFKNEREVLKFKLKLLTLSQN